MTTKTTYLLNRSSEAAYIHRDWVRALVIALPFGALAYIVGALLEGPSGQATALDTYIYPIFAVAML